MSTVDQCQMAALVSLEADAKLKRQTFGSQSYSPPKSSVASASSSESQPLEAARADTDNTAKKGIFFRTFNCYV